MVDHITAIDKESYIAIIVRADNCLFPKEVYVFHSFMGDQMIEEMVTRDFPNVNVACDVEFVRIDDHEPFIRLLQLVVHKRVGFSTLKRIIDL
jgi:hypothetical protein